MHSKLQACCCHTLRSLIEWLYRRKPQQLNWLLWPHLPCNLQYCAKDWGHLESFSLQLLDRKNTTTIQGLKRLVKNPLNILNVNPPDKNLERIYHRFTWRKIEIFSSFTFEVQNTDLCLQFLLFFTVAVFITMSQCRPTYLQVIDTVYINVFN